MKKNLILTAAVGLDASQIKLFVKTLRKYYRDEICVIIGQKDQNIEKELLNNNCIFIKTTIDKRDIQLKRYKIFFDFLADKEFNKILFCDSRDIYFQSNPFDFPFKGSINFFLEDKKIKDCRFNSEWIKKTYGIKILGEMSEKIISCGGTILGDQKSLMKFLKLMIKETKAHKFKKRLKYILTFRRDKGGRGSDQAHGNYIAHNNLIENSCFYPNSSGPIATVYHLKNIQFIKKLELVNELSRPYSVVHQFDKRWDKFSKAVEFLKKDLNIS